MGEVYVTQSKMVDMPCQDMHIVKYASWIVMCFKFKVCVNGRGKGTDNMDLYD